MLHIRFAASVADTSTSNKKIVILSEGGAGVEGPAVKNAATSSRGLDLSLMMKLVARNAKRGAAFTPQGVLRWPLTSAQSADVLAETRTLLESLTPSA
jgi:transcription-repair coupling factor (superfamily II helicase)